MREVTLQLSPPPPPPPPLPPAVMDVDEPAAVLQSLALQTFRRPRFSRLSKRNRRTSTRHKLKGARHSCVVSQFHYENITYLKCLLQLFLSRVKCKSGGFLHTHRPLLSIRCLPQRKYKKLRRRRLRALATATLPDGQIPDPYTSVWVREFGGDANKTIACDHCWC